MARILLLASVLVTSVAVKIKVVATWPDSNQPTLDFDYGYCDVSIVNDTKKMFWDCDINYLPVAGGDSGDKKRFRANFTGVDPDGNGGSHTLHLGADRTGKAVSEESQFFKDNLFFADESSAGRVAEKNPTDTIKIMNPDGDNGAWDCSRHYWVPLPSNAKTCMVSLIRQPSWDMVNFWIYICNDGWNPKPKKLDEKCNGPPEMYASVLV